jgi:hypothetical protein
MVSDVPSLVVGSLHRRSMRTMPPCSIVRGRCSASICSMLFILRPMPATRKVRPELRPSLVRPTRECASLTPCTILRLPMPCLQVQEAMPAICGLRGFLPVVQCTRFFGLHCPYLSILNIHKITASLRTKASIRTMPFNSLQCIGTRMSWLISVVDCTYVFWIRRKKERWHCVVHLHRQKAYLHAYRGSCLLYMLRVAAS